MPSIGSAALILSANGGQLKSGLDAAKSDVSNFASQSNSILSNIGQGLAFGGIAAGIGAAVGLVTSGFSRLTEIGNQTKQALALGVDPSQYQALGLVLQKAGIDATQAGDFFGSFAQKMERAARTGAGPVAAAMQNLGVDLQHLRSLPLDEQFLEVADAISKLPPGAQQAGIAMNVFGSTALLPQLQKGRAGLEEFMEAARRNGEVLSSSELEAAQKASKAWEDAKKTLTKAWDSVSLSVASSLAPMVSKAAEVFKQIVEFAKPVIEGVSEVFKTTAEVVGPLFTIVSDAIKEAINWVKELGGTWGIQFPTIREMTLNVFQAVGQAGAFAFDTLKAGAGGVAYAMSYLVEAVGNVTDAWNTLANGITTHHADAGASIRRWGSDAMTSWGNSSAAVTRYFDNLRRRQTEAAAAPPVRPPNLQPPAQQGAGEYRATAALVQGSKEAYSIEVQAKLATQLGVRPADMAERQVALAEEQVAALNRIEGRLGDENVQTLRAV